MIGLTLIRKLIGATRGDGKGAGPGKYEGEYHDGKQGEIAKN